MPFNAALADRVHRALADQASLRTVRMFGGLAFMIDDRLVVCVSAGGADLLVRVDPQGDALLLERPGAQRAEMGTGRSMGEGWITVEEKALAHHLDAWIAAALTFHAAGSGKKRR